MKLDTAPLAHGFIALTLNNNILLSGQPDYVAAVKSAIETLIPYATIKDTPNFLTLWLTFPKPLSLPHPLVSD